MRSLQRALGLALLALCGVLVALIAYRSTHRSTGGNRAALNRALAESEGGLQNSNGAAGSATGSGTTASGSQSVPQLVPDIRMPDLQGHTVALSQYRGHSLIINFWATWCPPCRREMPLLQELWTRYSGTGLRIVGIAVDSPDAVTQYLRHTSVGYPLLVGEQQGSAAATRFGIEPVLPFSVFADAQGRIVAVKVGELHDEEARYIVETVQQVSEGSRSLPQARIAIAEEMRRLALQRAHEDPAAGPQPLR